ncbi:hypothetical protein QFC22_001264 [Naganishia vaughanmartiniae]|uniref:Uncharacterized protein n=1 Tax=Naganishia vaughanmartiniae TaxID=1424756 RepID=A0ACC2XI56_9TREE|nr:hypothetical protein QFC22_001264 [Naganishia vaughanmartiniae]
MSSANYRYDILHLLPTLPTRPTRALSPASSTGWSDIPSDAEDTFFLSGDEGQEYEREKKRRRIDAGRERRVEALRARMADEEEERRRDERPADDVWGGNDEEVCAFTTISDATHPHQYFRYVIVSKPPEAIKTLMRHTYKSLAASPNPQVLELRILTHHSGDARFSFLKGRYKATWEAIKRGEDFPRPADLRATSGAAGKGGIGGLMGDYGDSDSDAGGSSEEEEKETFVPPLPESEAPPAVPDPPPEPAQETSNVMEIPTEDPALSAEQGQKTPVALALEEDDEEKARAVRREKARAWMAARKQVTEGKVDEG